MTGQTIAKSSVKLEWLTALLIHTSLLATGAHSPLVWVYNILSRVSLSFQSCLLFDPSWSNNETNWWMWVAHCRSMQATLSALTTPPPLRLSLQFQSPMGADTVSSIFMPRSRFQGLPLFSSLAYYLTFLVQILWKPKPYLLHASESEFSSIYCHWLEPNTASGAFPSTCIPFWLWVKYFKAKVTLLTASESFLPCFAYLSDPSRLNFVKELYH